MHCLARFFVSLDAESCCGVNLYAITGVHLNVKDAKIQSHSNILSLVNRLHNCNIPAMVHVCQSVVQYYETDD